MPSTQLPRFVSLLPALAVAFVAGCSSVTAQDARHSLSTEQARRIVAPFYDMLNRPATKDLKALSAVIAPEWRSYSGENQSKGRDEFVAQVGGFGKLIPDLAWDIKEMLVDGDRIIVRGEASGTPQGPFFGVAPGGKRFQIMTIDIHTVRHGKLVVAYHVEDWAGAIRQLSAK